MWQRRQKPTAATEATVARIKAEDELAKTRAETPKYRALAESLRDLRRQNNFASAIETSFRGGRV